MKLNEAQQVAAYAINVIQQNAPKCPDCHSTVMRPKCFLELGEDCPRHELQSAVNETIHLIEKRAELPRMWQYEASLIDTIGKPTANDLQTLRWVADNDSVIKSPKHVDAYDSFVLKHCGGWSCLGNTWTWKLYPKGLEYLKFHEALQVQDNTEKCST
jgi:hypothetical protein